jgi:signal transduction histidine kinase
MSSRKTATAAFISAVVLLLLCGTAVMIAISRYSESTQWVNHAYDVKVATSEVESTLAEAARDRLSYVTAGDPGDLQRYQSAKAEISGNLQRVRELTMDSPRQHDRFNRLEFLANQRIALLQTSLDARASGKNDAGVQSSVSLQNTKLASDVAAVINDMQNEEDALLARRKQASSQLFAYILWIFGAMLACAVFLLWIHYRFLNQELGKREEAENGARRLSVHVLELQDEERRKFSRELHDGLGQNLTVAKMIAASLSEQPPHKDSVPELIDLLDRSIQETRTISYLLHPPLLDELGIASAAAWYLEGFSKRSGIEITQRIDEQLGRLPRPAELVLFRVLQESLTNVHRHAKSQRADVSLFVADGSAVLKIRDYGIGIPPEKLTHFQSNGTHVGVGLTGMRDRVREHGGQFRIRSTQDGTEVQVTLPLGTAAILEQETATASQPGRTDLPESLLPEATNSPGPGSGRATTRTPTNPASAFGRRAKTF